MTKQKNKKTEETAFKLQAQHVKVALEWLLVVVLVSLSLLLFLSNINNPLNLRVFSVNSGSMEPTIKTGSLVFTRPSQTYEEQQIITFSSISNSSQTTTHRIIQKSVDTDQNTTTYRTKGDANEDPDPGFVRQPQIIGGVVFTLPLLGYVVSFTKTQLGFTLLVIIPATLLIFTELTSIQKEVKALLASRKEEKAKKEESPKKLASKKTTKKTTKKKKEDDK